MTKYKFEAVDTSTPPNAEDLAYALMSAFGALASTVVGKDTEKQAELFSKLDQALAHNQGASSYIELARICQATKFSLTGER
ncbi:hypothetical protein WYG_2562 [Citrobacter sp. A1]|uniref:Uncharacterized protein n=1 Tax=Citrobacter freundii TaxID=546 RepID=A0AA44NHZ7_CITFR|nr:hypothetical protein [Citrobacter freundii]EJF22557.1 hypothetical protein WYG_2562 [Citrobacter sp. A1]EKU35460.1 hypothetical protein B397_1297 [Citrobacter sp. L17]OYQ93682.1 hypothetical protein B9P90_20960 [Citrobacter freundii]OYQ99575.1 hypothetical protein B9P89_20895 [Citrobacter freundii]QGJ41263.1 hypothetical protein E4179_13535 [Citrobacter freundii]